MNCYTVYKYVLGCQEFFALRVINISTSDLYIHLYPVFIQNCPTMSDNDQQ